MAAGIALLDLNVERNNFMDHSIKEPEYIDQWLNENHT